MKIFNKYLFCLVLTGGSFLFPLSSFAGDFSIKEHCYINKPEDALCQNRRLNQWYQRCMPTPVYQWIDATTRFPLTEKALRRICSIEKIDVNAVLNKTYGSSRFVKYKIEFQPPSQDALSQAMLFIKQNCDDVVFMESVGQLFVQNLKEVVNPYKTLDATFHWSYFSLSLIHESDIFERIQSQYKDEARSFLDVRLQVIYTYKPPHTFSSEAVILMNALNFDPVERKIHEYRDFRFEPRKPRLG